MNRIRLSNIAVIASAMITGLAAGTLARIGYFRYWDPVLPTVIWDGQTVLSPLTRAANVLIPVGVVWYAFLLCSPKARGSKRNVLLALLAFAFAVVSVLLIAIGMHYCDAHLDGLSFARHVWWLPDL